MRWGLRWAAVLVMCVMAPAHRCVNIECGSGPCHDHSEVDLVEPPSKNTCSRCRSSHAALARKDAGCSDRPRYVACPLGQWHQACTIRIWPAAEAECPRQDKLAQLERGAPRQHV